MITIEDVQAALPANLKKSATTELVDMINNIATDPLLAEQVRENFISYTGVLKDGRFKTEDYIHAVAFVTYKLLGDSNKDAWAKVFPHRYATLVQKGASQKDIAAHVSAYNKGRLVNLILEQTLVPTWVLNAHIYQKAINTQAQLMMTASSEKVRSDAANSLLTHLKKPEAIKADLNINMNDASGLNEMKEALAQMAATQQQMIANGVGIKVITDSKIIENEDVNNGAAQA